MSTKLQEEFNRVYWIAEKKSAADEMCMFDDLEDFIIDLIKNKRITSYEKVAGGGEYSCGYNDAIRDIINIIEK